MKSSLNLAMFVLLVFVLTMVASTLFTLKTVQFYSYFGTNAHATVAPLPSYLELLYIVVGILVFTGIILVLIRYGLLKIIVGFFAIVSFLVLTQFFDIVLSPLFLDVNDWFIFLPFIASIFIVVYYFKYTNTPFRNFVNILIFLTIASIISLALGVIPSIILIAIIAVYDYIAVFVTKHMVTLAKGLSGQVFFGGLVFAARKVKKGRLLLGGGDIVFPAILVDALYVNYPPIAATIAMLGALVGLSIILFFGKKGKPYPAMTFIGPAQLGFFGLYLLISALI